MVRINAVLTDELAQALDRVAREEHLSRSAVLRRAAEWYLEEHRRKEVRRRERARRALETQDRRRDKSGGWDGVAEVRRWREAGE